MKTKINAVSSNRFYNLIGTIKTTNPAHRLTSSIVLNATDHKVVLQVQNEYGQGNPRHASVLCAMQCTHLQQMNEPNPTAHYRKITTVTM